MKSKTFVEPLIEPITFEKPDHWWDRIINWRFRRRRWLIVNDWVLWSEFLGKYIRIPALFSFDGASIPKIFAFIVTSTDGLFYGAIVHDYIYQNHSLMLSDDGECFEMTEIDKTTGDKLLYMIPKEVEGVAIPNSIGWLAVKLFGFRAWKQSFIDWTNSANKKDKKNENL